MGKLSSVRPPALAFVDRATDHISSVATNTLAVVLRSFVERLLALILFVALSPTLAAVALLVWLNLGRPVLFKQLRTGFGGRPFELYKFRTMREGNQADAERLTNLGLLLRRYSLDELPQLLNVIRGELRFVGPRPLLHKYWTNGLYEDHQARRFDVMPGITGWAQINGRNDLSWDEKFALDTWYVEHQSLALDVKILLRTAGNVLKGEGISQNGHATMEEFRGSRSTTTPHMSKSAAE